MIEHKDSWHANHIDIELNTKSPYRFDLTNGQKERPCKLCGKIVRMIASQKFCTACSMIPSAKRKKMMAR